MVRRFFTLNFLDAFIAGITTVAVPLLMLEHGIGVAAIGLAFSLMPLAKLVVRLGSSALADSVGERALYALNALSNLAQSVVYSFFATPAGFSAGKMIEGAKESFIWSVNRTSIMAKAPHRAHYVLGEMVSGRLFYNGLGSLAVWLLFPFGGFGLLLALMAALSCVSLAISLKVENVSRMGRPSLSDFSFLGREKRFYETIGAMASGSAFYVPLLYMILPLYFKFAGFSLQDIGMMYAAYFLIFGISLNALSSRKAPSFAVAVAGVALFVASLSGIAFAPAGLAPAFFLAMSFGDACLALLFEEILYLQTRNKSKKSTEIALMHIPTLLAVMAVSGASGFAIDGFGFAPLLMAGALSLVAFGAWGMRLAAGAAQRRLCPEWLAFADRKAR